MSQNKVVQLAPKYWKALELIEEGTLSIKEIAKSIGMSKWTLYELMSGNTAKTGSVGELFYSELRKMHARNVSKVKHLHKDNQRLALIKLNERLRELHAEKKPTKAASAEVCKILNSIGKAQPNVEITNNSWAYTKGLTAEELVYEFQRLGAIARSTLDGKGIQGTFERGPGDVSGSNERRGQLPEEP